MSARGSWRNPFISPPYADCPACGERDAFGVLMVNRRSCVRRCHECGHTQSDPLPPLDRRLIYLDQLALSNLAKAQADQSSRTPVEAFWPTALARIDRLVLLQLLACPRSSFHEEEGLVWSGYESLRAVGRRFSAELEFHDYKVIRNGQLYDHAQLWEHGRGDEEPPLHVDQVVDGDIHGWQPRLLIDARLPIPDDLVEGLNMAREAEDEGLAGVWARWADEDVLFDDRLLEEARAYGPVVMGLVESRAALLAQAPSAATFELLNEPALVTFVTIRHALEDVGVPKERSADRAAEYLRSESLVNVPFNRISSLLYAALAHRARSGQKGVTRGMTNDVRMISTLLPYVDAIFIDKECHVLLTESPVFERIGYDTRLFSHRNKEEFIAHLEDLESSASDEHLALLEQVYGRT